MLLELLLSAAAVYGGTAAYKAGKWAFGGPSNCGLQGRDGKYEYRGKKYDTLEEYSAAEWRQMERNRLRMLDESRQSSGRRESPEEARLRAMVKEWDEKGL